MKLIDPKAVKKGVKDSEMPTEVKKVVAEAANPIEGKLNMLWVSSNGFACIGILQQNNLQNFRYFRTDTLAGQAMLTIAIAEYEKESRVYVYSNDDHMATIIMT